MTRRIVAGGESITQRLDASTAADGRDALAKVGSVTCLANRITMRCIQDTLTLHPPYTLQHNVVRVHS